MAVIVVGSFRFSPEAMAEVRPQVQRLVEATRREDGCIAYDVGEDIAESGLLRFSEIWTDRASLDRHLQAPHIAPWREFCGGIGVIERNFTTFDAEGSGRV
jgi:quinol monooxygenase YgiN